MPARKRPLVFIDLDETLILAAEPTHAAVTANDSLYQVFDYTVRLRPEGHDLLRICRERGREVYLFTHATFGSAVEVSRALRLGFEERTIFSTAMILNCRPGLCPRAALIDDRPPDNPNTQSKIEALGLPREQVWVITRYEPPRFPSARLFLAGLLYRLLRLDYE